MVSFSPFLDIALPDRKPANLLQVLTTVQVLDLAEAVPSRYHGLIVAEIGLGLRPGELFGLTVDRVDFLKRTVRIDQQLVRDRSDGGVKLSSKLKTRTSYRTLPLAPTVADALAAHLDLYGPHPEMNLIFTNEYGRPIQQYPFREMFENARVRAGIPEWTWGEVVEVPTPHDLRHYYASLLTRTESPKVVQARLGHSSIKVTYDCYGHLFPDEEDRTRQAVEDELAGAISQRSTQKLRPNQGLQGSPSD
jgi:integrase